jgi:hypothetical protein
MNRILLAICLLFTAGSATTAPIYVTEDDAGNPVFSDQKSESSEVVKLKEPTLYSPSEFIKDYEKAMSDPTIEAPVGFKYQTLTVATPGDEASIRDNTGTLELLFVIKPGIQTGHRIALMMDGEKHSNIAGTGSLMLENIDRGTHEFYLEVIRAADNSTIQTGPATTVSVLRHAQPQLRAVPHGG